MWPTLLPKPDLGWILHEAAKRGNAFQKGAGDQSRQQVALPHAFADAQGKGACRRRKFARGLLT